MTTVTNIKGKMTHYTTELTLRIINNRKQKYPSDTVSQYYDYSSKMCHVEMSGLILQGSVGQKLLVVLKTWHFVRP